MSYFQAKSDLKFMKEFRQDVLELWQIESTAAKNLTSGYSSKAEFQSKLQVEATKIEGYQAARERVAKKILRAARIGAKSRVPTIFTSYPAPAVGGPVLELNLFSAILKDTSHGGLVDNQTIFDAISETLGECESKVKSEFLKLINPLYWIKEIIELILRIPFMIIEATGFDIGKVEDHLISKLFKFLELLAIGYLLLKLKVSDENLGQIILKLFR